jgi:hypothetical protein
MAKILVKGSKYARDELHQEEKPFVLRIRNKPILCLIDSDTREAKCAFEFVAGPVKLISPWASIYEVNEIESQMRDTVRKALKSFCFGSANDIIADIAEISRREEAAKREESWVKRCSSS